MIADAVMYEVRTQLISSKLAEKLPCMKGSATLAMVWSSNCSTVAPIVHTVIIARWRTTSWTVSPGISATLSLYGALAVRMVTTQVEETPHLPCKSSSGQYGATGASGRGGMATGHWGANRCGHQWGQYGNAMEIL